MVQTIQEDVDPKQEINSLRLVQLAGLIGRDKEIEAVSTLMQRSDVRLVTITGPGGVGKTRLALQVATLIADNFPDGAYFISLAALKDSTLVIPTLAQEIGSVESGDKPLFARLTACLGNKRLLLLLDNFEHVTAAGLVLSDLLAACSGLKILVTSREVLRIRIEREFVVPPLGLPPLGKVQDITQLTHYPAVELFVQRATAVQPDFQVTTANVRDIAEICIRLDGLPLAIELAAAHIKLLSPHALLARLDHRLQLLTTGARDLPKRQRTLRNTLTWSYDLLNTEEQMIFRLLSVFPRSCTLEAAEHICSMLHPMTRNVLEVFTSLIDKNLLQRVENSGKDIRIRLLETVREYAQELLMQHGEVQTAFQAHALYYLTLAEQAEPEMRKSLQAIWLDRLEQERDNLRAALQWLMEHKDIERVLRLGGALCHFWLIRGYQDEGYQWMKKTLAAARSCIDEELFTTTWRAGYAMTPEQAITLQPSTEIPCQGGYPPYTLKTPETHYNQQEQGEEQCALLTLREIEVLRLVATGLTNPQIADQLVISPRTVQAHLRSIYNKLEVSSRSAATRYALEHRFI